MTIVSDLLRRQRALALYGLAMLAFAAFCFGLQALDLREIDGINVWMKPAKFFVSVAIFALTAAWFFGYVRPERRGSRSMRWTVAALIAGAGFELFWIVWQAAHGVASHFNDSTPLDTIMFALMGLFAIVLVSTTLPLAWEIGRRPAQGLDRDFAAAVVIGLVLTFFLGGGLGGYMSAHGSHSVGVEAGHVPVFGWNRSGGDLRPAHFLGIHAQQIVPIMALLVTLLPVPLRRPALTAGIAAFIAVTLSLFAQGVAGQPLFPL
jgi:hypothetical protein